ncbi:MAG: putative capsular polysaccharide synthesis family protein [Lachnospiraceae bacterium]|jgi:hypothetical protein|nr:putative capsular polysaccharide synthesis family protein [Lachnospiraceae bacterium]
MIGLDYIANNPELYLCGPQITLYGAGADGEFFLDRLRYIGANVVAFCDSHKEGFFCGLPIIKPEALGNSGRRGYIIISTSRHRTEIMDLLAERGFDDRLLGIDKVFLSCLYGSCSRDGNGKAIFDFYCIRNYEKNRVRSSYLASVLEDSVYVYQPGRVGSKSVYDSIVAAMPTLRALHTHNLTTDYKKYFGDAGWEQFAAILRARPTKIVALVREPMARLVSHFFHVLFLRFPMVFEAMVNQEEVPFGDIYEKLLNYAGNHQDIDPFMWYDEELKAVFGIDVYAYPFDREKGYGIIKENNTEVLVIKLETMNIPEKTNSFEDVIGEFCGIKGFRLLRTNEARNKMYSELYREAWSNRIFSKDTVDYYYRGNERMNHFYSEEEKLGFLRKMEKNIPPGYIDEYTAR